MYDLIVVGAGPAGLTCALYAARASKKVLVLEAKAYGGQIVNASQIENYPGIANISGFDFATALYSQVENLGVTIKYEDVKKVLKDKTVITDKNQYQAKAVVLATGVTRRKLELAGEDEFLGKGISYCATCDGNFYKNKVVAVYGGGNTALEDAIYLANLAKKVYLIHRRDTFRGENTYLLELEQKANVEILTNCTIAKLIGTDCLEKIVLNTSEKGKKEIPLDGLFIAIGQTPDNDRFKNVVDLDKQGYIKTLDGVRTKTKGIYVAGDTRQKDLRQLTTSVSDGSIAATVAIQEML